MMRLRTDTDGHGRTRTDSNLGALCWILIVLFLAGTGARANGVECLGVIGECVSAFAVQGHYVYAAGGYTLHVIDIANPAKPTEVGWARSEYHINSVEVLGSIVYLGCDEDGGVQMVDVADPAKPKTKKIDENEKMGGNTHTVIELMGKYLIYRSSGSLLGTHWFEVYDVSGMPRPITDGLHDDDVRCAYATDGQQIFCTKVISEKGSRVICIEDRTSTTAKRIGQLNSAEGLEVELGFHFDKNTGKLTFGMEGVKSALPIANWPNAERVWPSTEGEAREPDPEMKYSGESVLELDDGALVIKNKKNGREISRWGTRLFADIVKVADRKAYVIGGDRLSIVDCADPGRPGLISQYPLSGETRACAIENDALFLINKDGDLFTIDIAEPTSPTLAGTMHLNSDTFALTASGDRLYAASKSGLNVYDIKNPAKPAAIGRFETEKPACDLATSGSLVYLMHADSLSIVDASDTTKPILCGKLDVKWRGDDEEPDEDARLALKRLGNILYLVSSNHDGVAYDSHVKIVDVTNPAEPALVGGTGATCSDDEKASPKITAAKRPATKATGWLLALPAGFHISNQNGHELHVFDLSDPKKPALIGIYESIHDPYTSAFLFKDRIYKPDGDGGLLILGSGK
ncbi:MAG: hypothetical protein ABFD69_07915 [Candidatus Sumerlaeia bacterium]